MWGERQRRQQEASDKEYHLQTLTDIALQACFNKRDVTQERLDALELYDPKFYLASIPEDASHVCSLLYVEFLRKLANGERLQVAWVNGALARYENRKREEEAARKRVQEGRLLLEVSERRRKLLRRAGKAIERCDFTPTWQQQKGTGRWYLLGFDVDEKKWAKWNFVPSKYHFEQRLNFDQLEVSLLFTFSCLAVTHNLDVTGACNGALDVANRKWDMPGFKEGLIPSGGYAEQYSCMNYLVDHYRQPSDFKRFHKLLDKAAKKYRAAFDRRAKKWERDSRRARERSRKKSPRPPSRNQREREDRGDLDFDRAEEVIGRLKGSL